MFWKYYSCLPSSDFVRGAGLTSAAGTVVLASKHQMSRGRHQPVTSRQGHQSVTSGTPGHQVPMGGHLFDMTPLGTVGWDTPLSDLGGTPCDIFVTVSLILLAGVGH